MKLTKKQLKGIIKEELQNFSGNMSENLGAQQDISHAVGNLAEIIVTQIEMRTGKTTDLDIIANPILQVAMDLLKGETPGGRFLPPDSPPV
tara:strand:+ start:2506 stop:2778 length:273 start_codon:yes stop_codon:yes gene_type:complete